MDNRNTPPDTWRTLSDDIQEALRTGNYTKLRDTVNATVNTVVDKTVNCAKNAEKAAERIIDESFPGNGRGPSGPSAGGWKAGPRQAPGYRQNDRSHAFKRYSTDSYPTRPQPVSQPAAKKNVPACVRRSGTELGLGITMGVVGVLGAVPAFTASMGILFGSLSSGLRVLPLTGAAVLCTVAVLFAGLAVGGFRMSGRAKRFRRYWPLLSQKGYCTVERLADAVEKKPDFVVRDLKRMARAGLIPQMHMDDQETCVMLGAELYQHYLDAQASAKAREARKPEEKNDVFAAGMEAVRKIRSANDALPDPVISEKLSRLEEVTTCIFAHVKQRPAKLPEIRRFMDYYLPTTVKLVESYQDFESQPETESIRQAKAEILETLDTINVAFERLLDGLFQDDAMDISTDISALKSMLAQEGLTGHDDFK